MLKLRNHFGIFGFPLLTCLFDQLKDIVVNVVDRSSDQDNGHEQVDDSPSSCTDLLDNKN